MEFSEKNHHCCSGDNKNISQKTRQDLQKKSRLKKSTNSAENRPNNTYICPMCPGVEHIGPSVCPMCGMALEPLAISLEDESGLEEYYDMLRRLVWALVFTVPLFVTTMSSMMHAATWLQILGSPQNIRWLEFGLALPVCTYVAWPFYQRAWASIKTLHFNMFTLIGMGVVAAYGYSCIATILPEIFPPTFQLANGLVAVYFESAAMIVTLVIVGQVLELKARQQTNSAVKSLLALKPHQAHLINDDGAELDIPLDSVTRGNKLRVRPGESVPIDGIIITGTGQIDESMISGEARPAHLKQGDAVIGATLNLNGSFVMKVTKTGADTVLAQIVNLVSQAQRSRAPIQKVADKVSGWFVPLVLLIALLTYFIWLFLGPDPRAANALINAVAVLIIACPCALGLATPMSIMVATGRAARSGILFKNAEAIETLRKANTLVIDKTGTLTEGQPKVTNIQWRPDVDQKQILSYINALEKNSEHPIAQALAEYSAPNEQAPPDCVDFEAFVGLGATAAVNGQSVAIGNRELLEQLNIKDDAFISSVKIEYGTTIYVSINQRISCIMTLEDQLKDSSFEAIRTLKNQNIEIIMLTGDCQQVAKRVADQLGILDFEAEVKPHDKFSRIKNLQASGKIVAMAGDGINDAPAIAQADIGIAMGDGTDITKQSAHLTLVKGDLRSISHGINISKTTMRNIRQNLFFAFGYNLIGVPIAAGALYPFFGIVLSPAIAALAMSLSSVSVISNALRLRRI
jgi:P-type Cu+ transporter